MQLVGSLYLYDCDTKQSDLKPENMIIDLKQKGHLCLIDFGTAKDLDDTSLNGPNFVGTPGKIELLGYEAYIHSHHRVHVTGDNR